MHTINLLGFQFVQSVLGAKRSQTTEANVTYGDFLYRPRVWKAKRCQILKKPLYHQLHKLFPPVHTLPHRLRYTISREISLYQQQWFVVGIFQLGIFKQKWQDYEVATGLDQKNQLVRLATFRSVVGKECLQIFRNLNLPLVKMLFRHHSKHWRIILSSSETWFTKGMGLILVVKHPTRLLTVLSIA